jgi:hypothetical protein
MNWISLLTISVSLFHCTIGWCAIPSVVSGCDNLGSHIQILSYDVATNGAGQVVYAWLDSEGEIHAALTKSGETSCTELPTPNVQGAIAARSKPPQITIDNQGTIKLAFLTATSNNFNLPPAAPQIINGIKVSTLNINAKSLNWTDISTGLNFTQSQTARGNNGIQLSMAGNGQGDAMLIWFEEQAQFNDNIKAAIFNTGISNSPKWITYTLDAKSNIDSHSIGAGNSKPIASINAAGAGMFFWLGSAEGTPIIHRHLRAAAINASQKQKKAPATPTPKNVGHHIDLQLPIDGIIAFAGTIDASGDALAIWPDINPEFSKMQYNTYSAKTKTWGSQDPDRTIPGSLTTAQTNTILMQLATDPGSLNSFAVWNQSPRAFNTTLFASVYNKSKDTWSSAKAVVDDTSGEYSIGVDCQGEGLFVYREGSSDVKASVFPNISRASLSGRQNLGVINPGKDDIIILPMTAVVQECLKGSTRRGVAVWGVQTGADDEILQSAFFDVPPSGAPGSSGSVSPPLHFRGKIKKNKFVTQTDITNQLYWTPSPDKSVVEYLIRGSDGSTARVSASEPSTATFHHRRLHKIYTYTIVAVTKSGKKSSPLKVKVATE